MLELIPKGIHIEKTLHARIGNIYASSIVHEKAKESYLLTLENYKSWSNLKFKEVIGGSTNNDYELLEVNLERAKRLISDEETKCLLNE